MRTLYISDLDGTLLLPGAVVGDKTRNIINHLIEKGEYITFCTARNYPCAKKILSEFNLRLPVALVNGALIYDIEKNVYIEKNFISDTAAKAILEAFYKRGLYPFVYKLQNDKMSFEYVKGNNAAGEMFIRECAELFSKHKRINGYSYNSDIVYFSIFGGYAELSAVYEDIKNIQGIFIQFYQDVNTRMWLIEIQKSGCNKKTAAEFIKNYCGAEEVVAFGDNDNDIPMIDFADIGVAVENCTKNMRDSADFIIGKNTEESVPEYIKNYIKRQKSI